MAQSNMLGVGESLLFFPASQRDRGSYLKNLLLFFDDVRLVAPKKTRERAWQIDEAIYGPLEDAGILTEPSLESLLDMSLVPTDFQEAMSEPNGMERFMLGELWRKVQADPKVGGEGGAMDMLTPTAFAILYSCSYRRDPQSGALLSPGTDTPELVSKAQELWAGSNHSAISQVIQMDVQQVGVDTGSVPIDEYLAFRAEHRDVHRRYMQAVRGFCEQLQSQDTLAQTKLLAQRQQEIADYGAELNRATPRSLAQPGSVFVGIGGVAWSVATGDPTGALIGVFSVMLGATPQKDHGTYSYLFSAKGI